MQNSISIVENKKKHHYDLNINGVILGTWEACELDHLVQTIDNKIGLSVKPKNK